MSPSLRIGLGIDSINFSWAAYWATRYASAGKIIVNSDTQLTLYWTNNGTQDYDEVSVYMSTDGVTYTEEATATTGDSDVAVTGLSLTDTEYYFKIRYKKGTNLNDGLETNCLAFTIPATTSGAETLQFHELWVASGWGIRINWDDTNSENSTATSGSTSHAYSGAGTYDVRVINAQALTDVYLRDAKFAFNSEVFLKCGDNLESIILHWALTNPTVDSSDFAHLTLSDTLSLYFNQAGTYNIDSSDFAGYPLSDKLYLYFNQAGTYNIDSSDFVNYTLSSELSMYFLYAGTYNIDSSDFAHYTLSSKLTLLFVATGTLNTTIAKADFDGFPLLDDVRIEMNLSQTQVDDILLGFYDGLASKTVTDGSIDLAGQVNAAPSGTYQAQCPPTTGKEAAYELLNDSCGVSVKHWATITVEGGLP